MDMALDQEEITRQFSRLQLAEKSAIQLESVDDLDYVLDIAVQTSTCDDPVVAAACSTGEIHLLSRTRLSATGHLKGHTSTITGVSFGNADPNILLSSSKDRTIRCWDVRTCKEAQVTKAPSSGPGDLLCVDVSHSDVLVCSGAEKRGEDAMVLFWDRRTSKLLGSYSDCHQDDVTQVCFKPGSDKHLASGSVDGLLCTFDLSQTSEDDALQDTFNAGSAISKVGWCGDGNDNLYCVTTDNMVFSWDSLQGEDNFSIESLSEALGDASKGVEYVVDCIPELTACGKERKSAILVTGSNSGALQVTSHGPEATSVVSTLTGGHHATIRCAHWDSKTRTLLSGGEDSLLCLWSVDSGCTTPSRTPLKVPKAKAKVSSASKKPYKRKSKS